jgi:hypothetical protein
MKTASRIFLFVVLAVIATLVVVSYWSAHIVPNQKFLLYIGTKPLIGTPTYVEWSTEDDFDKALAQVCSHGGTYKISKLKAPNEKPYDALPCIEILKTVKVTKSKVANGAAAVTGDPHVTMKVAATSVEDISSVVNALSPTPNPRP